MGLMQYQQVSVPNHTQKRCHRMILRKCAMSSGPCCSASVLPSSFTSALKASLVDANFAIHASSGARTVAS